jgi:hypothetical protein
MGKIIQISSYLDRQYWGSLRAQVSEVDRIIETAFREGWPVEDVEAAVNSIQEHHKFKLIKGDQS